MNSGACIQVERVFCLLMDQFDSWSLLSRLKFSMALLRGREARFYRTTELAPTAGRTPLRRAVPAQHPARLALRDAFGAEHAADVLDPLAPLRRAQYFPEAASLRTALSSSASGRSRLSRAFSFSNSLSLRAWSSFTPPYSLRQR